jgi:signal transduction histidine kinase/PAS domain-containing protein
MSVESYAAFEEHLTLSSLLRTFDAMDVRVFLKDLEGRYVFMNRRCRHDFRVADGFDYRGTTDDDYFDATTCRQWKREECEFLTGSLFRQVLGTECERWRDGRETWTRLTRIRHLGVNGQTVGVLGICEQISEEVLTRESRNLAIEGSTAGFWHVDPTRRSVWISSRVQLLFELTPSVDTGLPDGSIIASPLTRPTVSRAFKNMLRSILADSRKDLIRSFRELRQGRRAIMNSLIKIRTSTGTRKWLRIIGRLIESRQGTQVAGAILDETKLQQERWLRDSILDAIPQMVFVKGRDLCFRYANAATHRNLGETSLIGKRDRDVITDEYQVNRFEADDVKAFQTDNLVEISEERLQFRDGSTHYLATTKRRFTDHFAQEPLIVGISTDISTLNRRISRFPEVMRAVQGMASTRNEESALHEFVTRILDAGYASCLLFVYSTTPDGDRFIPQIRYSKPTQLWSYIESFQLDPSDDPSRPTDLYREAQRGAVCSWQFADSEIPLPNAIKKCFAGSSRLVMIPMLHEEFSAIALLGVDSRTPEHDEIERQFLESLAAVASNTVVRHRRHNRLLEGQVHQLAQAKYFLFKEAAVEAVHQLNQSFTVFAAELREARSKRQIRNCPEAVDFLIRAQSRLNEWNQKINGGLDGFRIEEEPQLMRVSEVLERVESDFKEHAALRSCHVVLGGDLDLQAKFIERALWESLLILLHNAVDAGARQVTLKVVRSVEAVMVSRSYIDVLIIDDGEGIPIEDRDRVKQLGWTSKGRNTGHGLGLWLAHTWITYSHGTLTLTSCGQAAGEDETVWRIRFEEP